ncbi:hypothetical protein ACFYNO_13280 [Kitasatospora sp. NPDC006697]|uniref:hypothetical protein n=1 Tax=Kitasatospora sp. NPDC006697 TaxID=3364020 RepID=UPI00368C0418
MLSPVRCKEQAKKSLLRGETAINTAIARAVRAALVATTGAAVLTAGLAACGTVKELTAGQKVSDAFQKLGEGQDLSVKLSLDATPEQLTAYSKAVGDGPDEKAAKALTGLTVSISLHADKPLKDLKSARPATGASPDPQAEAELKQLHADYLIADRSGAALVELRQVAGLTYLHGDLKALATAVGEDPASVTEGLDAMGSSLAPLKEALSGGWAELDPSLLADSGRRAAANGDSGAAAAAQPTLDPKAQQNVLDSLKSAFTGDFSFEAKGKADGADQIAVSAPFRKLADDLLKAVKPVTDQLPKEAGLPTSAPTDLPDKNVSALLSIKNGALTGLSFDLAQLDKKAPAGTQLPLKLTFDQTAKQVQAPEKAVKLTEQDLTAAFGALAGGMAGVGAGADGSALTGTKFPDTPAPTLTDAQVQELVQKTGGSAEEIRAMNRLGLGYDQILAMGQDGGQS